MLKWLYHELLFFVVGIIYRVSCFFEFLLIYIRKEIDKKANE